MLPVRQTVRLSGGTVTLQAWGANVADAHLTDLLTLTGTLGHVREEWVQYSRGDIEPGVWGAFWRLVHAARVGDLPSKLTWNDRLTLLLALWELNDVEEAEGKLTALNQRAARLLTRIQGRMTPPSMSS